MPKSLKTKCSDPKCGEYVIWMTMPKTGAKQMINWDSLDTEEKKSALMGIEIAYQRLNETATDFKHLSHFVTCKNPDRFRKKKRQSSLFDR